ncbi:MAG TPA: TetR/AcrR family transcriptional regulator [Acidimicrobiales bacterium]
MSKDGVGVTAVEERPVSEQISESGRPMRADARRNYDLLVAAAKKVFSEHGGGASMEAIAKEAGVGVGTLYRHFPKRIDVVEAVYRTDVDGLVAASEEAVANLEPWVALVAWLHAFVAYADSKRTFINELHEAFDKHPEFRLESRERIEGALEGILVHARQNGEVRDDVSGSDLMQLLYGICSSPNRDGQSERLLVMIIDGLRRPA